MKTVQEAVDALRDASARMWCSFEDVTHREEFAEPDKAYLIVGGKRMRVALDCGTPTVRIEVRPLVVLSRHIETLDSALELVCSLELYEQDT